MLMLPAAKVTPVPRAAADVNIYTVLEMPLIMFIFLLPVVIVVFSFVFMFVLLAIKMISPGLVTNLNFSEHLRLKIIVILLGNNIFV